MSSSIGGLHQNVMGLDIGSDNIKVVELKSVGSHFKLVGYATAAINPHMLTKEGLAQGDVVAQKIIAACQSAKPNPIRSRIVATALPEELVFSKTLTIPRMKPREIAKVVPSEAAEFFPVPIHELLLDWTVLGSPKATQEINVYVVGTPTVIVDSLLAALKSAGMEVVLLETKSLATLRALLGANDKGAWVVIDVGGEHTTVSIADSGALKLTGTVDTGGKAINQAMDYKPEEEKKLKTFDAAAQALTYDALQQKLSVAAQPIVQEVQNAVHYFQNRLNSKSKITAAFITGGGANVPGLIFHLKETLGMSIRLGNPLVNLVPSTADIFPTAIALGYTSAIGSALSKGVQ